MCGIVGFVGREEAAPILLEGLRQMEYRGYDSAGIAVRSPEKGLQVKKSKGRLQALADLTTTARTYPAPWASAIPAGQPTANPTT